MRRFGTALIVLALVAGCASQQAPVAAPVQPPPSLPAPADPAPTALAPVAPVSGEPASRPAHQARLPERKLSVEEISYVVVSAGTSDGRSALLRPATHAAPIAALVNALNTVEDGYAGGPRESPRLRVNIHLKEPGPFGTGIAVHVDDGTGELFAAWYDPWVAIKSPAVAKALADLEPLLQPPATPGTHIWAVDPVGSKPPELILEREQPLWPAAASPDGRYWLLTQRLGGEKGDFSAVPYLLDRSTGALRQGATTEIRADVAWSGNGFTINRPTQLDLALKEDSLPALRKALGVAPNVRDLIHISFTPDGKRFAALVGQPGREEPVDLVLGNADGSGITVVPAAIRGTATQSGIVAQVELSPDGEWLTVAGKGPITIIRVADVSVRRRWTQLRQSSGWLPITWSPDSRYVAISGDIYDHTGKSILNVRPANTVTWRPDSKAVAVKTDVQAQILGLDGTITDLAVPDFSVPAGFLPDGRLIVFLTVYPAQQ